MGALFNRLGMAVVGATLLSLIGISLVVAAINVLNSLVARVAARRSEIGLRRAVGATRAAIRLHFVTEALLISGAGAVIGPSIGLLATALVTRSLGVPTVYNWWAVALAVALGLVMGTLGGVIPAIAASNQSPVDALRHEP